MTLTDPFHSPNDKGQPYEARFQTFFDTAAVGIGIMSLDRKIIDANPAMCNMLGMTRAELIGQTPAFVTYPQDYPDSIRTFEDLLAGRKDYFRIERRYVRKNGVIFWVQITMSIVNSKDGKPLYIVGMVEDIDEQKRVLAELQKSEAQMRTLFDHASIGIALVGLDGRPLAVNPAILSITGYSEEELLMHPDLHLSHPEDHTLANEPMRELLEGKREAFQVESRFLHKNGEFFWARQRVSVVRGEDGKPVHMVVMVEDIDEQKRIMGELEESERRFRAIFENSAIGISLLGLDRQPIEVNAATSKIFGYPKEEFFHKTVHNFAHPDDVNIGDREFQELLNGTCDSYQLEKRFLRKEGDFFWARLNLFGVYDQARKLQYIVSMTEDITEQKKAVEALRESEARFRTVFDSSATGIVILDVKTLTLRFNFAAQKIMNDPVEGRTLADPYEFIDTEYRQTENKIFSEILNGQRDSYQTDRCYLRPGQEPVWAHITISGIKDSHGNLHYVAGMLEDVTEQKIAQDRLQESEARFRGMFDNSDVGMTLISPDRHVIMVNPAIIRIMGYSESEILGKAGKDWTFAEDIEIGNEEFIKINQGQIDSFKLEKRYIHKDGHVFWTRQSISAVRDAAGKLLYMTVLLEDIDQQRRASEILAAQEAEYRRTLEERVEERTRELRATNLRLVGEIEQRQRAEESLAAKGVEEAIIAERTRLARDLHDAVTQTLFSASLIAEVLPELWEVDAEEARKSNEELRQLTRGALAEMRTLLLELRPSSLTQARITDLLKQLSEAVIGRARLPVNLVVEGEYELPAEIKVAFYRIAQESLNNIIKYSRSTQVIIHLDLDCCNVHLEIRDNGVGFDPATIKPTSMGMRIMHERAEAIGAHLNVSSTPRQGTCVSVDWNEDEWISNSKPSTRGEV
jgi:PAS domain S-box-containing protein